MGSTGEVIDPVRADDGGLVCEAGGFVIDPWRPTDLAIITHAHSDHARPGCGRYLTSPTGAAMLRARLGSAIDVEPLPWGERRRLGGVWVSLHPAGHLLGSAQVRIEDGRGVVTVVTGDFKREPDPTCEPWEPMRCDVLIAECTFGLPIYRWRRASEVFAEMAAWWRGNAAAGRVSVVGAYALGKAQRVIAGIAQASGPDGRSAEQPGPIAAHGAVLKLVEAYREAGVAMPEVLPVNADTLKRIRGSGLVVAPPAAMGTAWSRKLGRAGTAIASGWMAVRGRRRHRAVDRGFVLSDHVDWPGLLATVRESGARRVGLTHGFTGPAVRYLNEFGESALGRPIHAFEVSTRYRGERLTDETDTGASEADGGDGGGPA